MAKIGKNEAKYIRVIGATENNLQNVSVKIPRDTLTVITGPSGSGKSTLAFGVLHSEGQRRYLEGVSSYARNFLDISAKPDVEKIENLSPTIAINQKSISRSPRSTVGTITEINDYVRLLFSQIGEVQCPECNKKLSKKSEREILQELLQLSERTIIEIFSRVNMPNEDREHKKISWEKEGYGRVRLDGKIMLLGEALAEISSKRDIVLDIAVDRYAYSPKNPDKERLLDSLESAFKLGSEMVIVLDGKKEFVYQREYRCDSCNVDVSTMTPRHFSFNNPEGACSMCSGLGYRLAFDTTLLVTNPKLSLEEGAIGILGRFLGRGGSKGDVCSEFLTFSKRIGVGKRKPLGNYTETQKNVLFRGEKSLNFSGILAFLDEKYRETTSDRLRTELEKSMRMEECFLCKGQRLRREALAVYIYKKNIADWLLLSVEELEIFISRALESQAYPSMYIKTVQSIQKEIESRLKALREIGVGYLTLDRSSQSLSGGEAQRIRLATQCVTQLSGVLYILDEPSMGLHPRDTHRLIKTFQDLRDAGNTVLVVEHDRDIIVEAEWILDLGPGAGEEGGKIIFCGSLKAFEKNEGLTASYTFGRKKIVRQCARRDPTEFLKIIGATEHNLKDIDVNIPLGVLTCVTGVSGSGKSSLVHDILGKALRRHFYNAKEVPGEHREIVGKEKLDKVISVDQNPIGRTSRSNVATYTGIFSLIRDVYASISGVRGFDASRFSFNLKGGRCEVCQGEGTRKIEMYLMPDVYVPCDACAGTRYNAKTLEVQYQGSTIADVLNMSVSYAKQFFFRYPAIVDRLEMLDRVGLGYVRLGQGAPNLSGGEAQRIKLATELSRRSTGKTLYIFDEPTVGLHFEDVRKLLLVLDELVTRGNSVIVVEHNLDVARLSDWVIDMGPEGGAGGGTVVFSGTPQSMKKCKEGWTRKYI